MRVGIDISFLNTLKEKQGVLKKRFDMIDSQETSIREKAESLQKDLLKAMK